MGTFLTLRFGALAAGLERTLVALAKRIGEVGRWALRDAFSFKCKKPSDTGIAVGFRGTSATLSRAA